MNRKESLEHLYSGKSTTRGVTYYGKKYIVATYFDDITNETRHIVFPKSRVSLSDFLRPHTKDEKNKEIIYTILSVLIGTLCIGFELMFQKFVYQNVPFVYEAFYVLFQIGIAGFFTIGLLDFSINETIETKKFHAAEHMTARAFQDLGFVPDIDIIKSYSRYHPRCGISKITNLLFAFNLSYALHLIFGFYMIPLSLIPLLSVPFAYGPYSFIIQMLLTTSKPEDMHLVVAKECYKKLLSLEQDKGDIYDNEEMSWIRFDRAEKYIMDLYDFGGIDEEEAYFWKAEIEDINRQIQIEKIMFELER